MKTLTVKDLIKKLEALKDQDAIVVVTTDNFEQGQSKIPVSRLFEFKGELKREGFRDAFDGGSYSKEIASFDEKGKTNFVQIS